MDTTTLTDDDAVKTFRGRTLEELLPQIRAELGPEAIVLRRREGLAGGVAGFFQRSYVEVEARAGSEPALRNDRATEEGLASPAVQALVAQASPFADALARAAADTTRDVLLSAAPAIPAGLYGPQPKLPEPAAATREWAAPALAGAPAGGDAPDLLPVHGDDLLDGNDLLDGDEAALLPDLLDAPIVAPTSGPAPALGVERPALAARLEARLVAGGLSVALAEDVVGEAVAHGIPFAHPRALKRLARTALARRLGALSNLGAGHRTVAFVGAAGSGRSTAAHGLAAAYAQAGAEVVVVALRSPDGGAALAARLEPLGVTVVAAEDAAEAARERFRRPAALTILDAPAAGLADPAGVARLAAELGELGAGEVHLVLPATVSGPAADELATALAPLCVTHIALSQADQTTRPGAPVELAAATGRPLSYVCTRDALEPADPDALARRLLP